MGDMADYYLSLASDRDDLGYDGYDSWRDDGYGNAVKDAKILSCRHCSSENVYWVKTENGWRLFDSTTHKMHDCPKFKKPIMEKPNEQI